MKSTVESMIYNHFASYRLCRRDKSKWKTLYFAPRMNEIMPKFVKLYASADMIIQPLQNVNLQTTRDLNETKQDSGTADSTTTNNLEQNVQTTNANSGYTNGNSSTTESNTGDTSKAHLNKYSDTPQGAVTNLSNGYLTNVTQDEDTDQITNTGSTEGSTNSSYVDSTNATNKQTDTGTVTREMDTTNSGSREVDETVSLVGMNTRYSAGKLMEEYRNTIIDINTMLINELTDMFMQVYSWDEDEEEDDL